MENKKHISLVFLMLFGILSFLAAQTGVTATAPAPANEPVPQVESISQSENLSYYIVETEEGVRFVQRIEWNPVEYVYRYEAIVEQRDASNVYKEILNESTEVNFVEISIPAGRYRYKIKVYNLLNRLEGESTWQEFEVYLAIQPVLDSFSPGRFYLDEEGTTVITITGKDFVENAEVFLVTRPVPGKTQESVRLTPSQKKIDPTGRVAEASFSDLDLKIGMYDVVVQNPGGLRSSAGPFYISFQKPIDLNISIGWTPMKIFNYMSDSSETNEHARYVATNEFMDYIYYYGLSMRFTFIPIKKAFGYLGVELAPYISSFSGNESDGYAVEGFLTGANVNFVYQKHFIKRKLVGNARLGGGISMFYDLKISYDTGLISDPFTTWFYSANVGLSLQYFITKKVFVDIGADYQQNFSGSMPSGLIRPGIFFGYQF
ncbi:MAG: IPT/TIG domain-containing protein [Spirochaetaceae bacterium]|nr:IPT/TIG domain-containing protein [Spirochaetaceae bacterium]